MPPWVCSYYPPALRNVPTAVRRKALAIAEALRREGYGDAAAFRMALHQARGGSPPPLPGWTAKRVRGNSR